MQRLLSFLFVALAVSPVMGCAFANVDIHPTSAESATAGERATRGRGREIIVFTPFEDGRADRRCGMQMNVTCLPKSGPRDAKKLTLSADNGETRCARAGSAKSRWFG